MILRVPVIFDAILKIIGSFSELGEIEKCQKWIFVLQIFEKNSESEGI
jgi:hypothetical protein